MNFKKWIIKKLGYEPRQIDFARAIGERRGELIRKWFIGIAYPSRDNCEKLGQYLNMSGIDVQKEVLKARLKDLDENC